MLKKMSLIISIFSFITIHSNPPTTITYWNHDTINCVVSLHGIAEDGVEGIFDLIKIKAGQKIDCIYEESLTSLTKLVVINREGDRKALKKPFSHTAEQNCTVHIYKEKLEIIIAKPTQKYPYSIQYFLLKSMGVYGENKKNNNVTHSL